MAKAAASGRRSGGGLSNLSVAELQAELRRRQRRVGTLVAKYKRAAAKAETLRRQIEDLGGSVNGGPVAVGGARRRPRNEMNLVDALHKVLSGKTMTVTDAAEAVQKAGYKTTSSTFRTIVNQTLINSGKFKRVGRGQYTSK